MIGHCLAYPIGPKTVVIILSKNLEPHPFTHSLVCHVEKVHLKGEKERTKRKSKNITCPTFYTQYICLITWHGFVGNFMDF